MSMSTSSSITLLITARSRSVAASGATVKDVLRTRPICSAMPGVSVSSRIDGRLIAARRPWCSSISPASSGSMQA